MEAIAIDRDNVSDAVATKVRQMIVDGHLPDGDRINEVHLAQRLGVSRTPLREALSRLAQEGSLRQVARIGYFVRPLTLEEFEQIYAIRPILDPEALRLAALPSSKRIERLREINNSFASAGEADRLIDLDDEWHLVLIADCPNKVLLGLIRQFIQRTRRYELALIRERRNVAMANASHDAIMIALDQGNLEAACAALRTNLLAGRQPIAEWLIERELNASKAKETA